MPLFLPRVINPIQENVLRESATDGGFPQNAKSLGRTPVWKPSEGLR